MGMTAEEQQRHDDLKAKIEMLRALHVERYREGDHFEVQFFPPLAEPIAPPDKQPLEPEDMLFYSSPIQDLKK